MSLQFFCCPDTHACIRLIENTPGQVVAFAPLSDEQTLVLSDFNLVADERFSRHGLHRVGDVIPHAILKIPIFKSAIAMSSQSFEFLVKELGYPIKTVRVPDKKAPEPL